jgi:hypothetical protein
LISEDGTNDVSGMGAAKKLIALFKNMSNVSYMYVTHTIHSGLVTYQKKKSDASETHHPTSEEEVGVSNQVIEHWRRELQVNADEILVGFAFVHDDEYRLAISLWMSYSYFNPILIKFSLFKNI